MPDLLSILRLAIVVQAALLGGLLIYMAATRHRAVIASRIAKLTPELLTAPPAEVGASAWQLLLGRWALADIPTDQQEELYRTAHRFGVSDAHMGLAFGVLRGIAAIVFFGVIYGLLVVTIRAPLPPIALLSVAALLGVGASIVITRRMVAGLAMRRREAITRKIPYALELILIFLDAGLGLTNAFERVADALEQRQPALHEELKATIADLRVLGSQDLAFKNMAERIDTPNIHSIVNILRQSIQYGSPISEAMHNAIDLMRRTEILLLEEQANKLPAKITLLTLLTIFPPFIIVLAGPAMIGLTSALTTF